MALRPNAFAVLTNAGRETRPCWTVMPRLASSTFTTSPTLVSRPLARSTAVSDAAEQLEPPQRWASAGGGVFAGIGLGDANRAASEQWTRHRARERRGKTDGLRQNWRDLGQAAASESGGGEDVGLRAERAGLSLEHGGEIGGGSST